MPFDLYAGPRGWVRLYWKFSLSSESAAGPETELGVYIQQFPGEAEATLCDNSRHRRGELK